MDFTTILPDINSSLRILGITTFLGILAVSSVHSILNHSFEFLSPTPTSFKAQTSQTQNSNRSFSSQFLTSVLTRIIYNIFFHPLRHYPGPISHAATDLPLVYQSVTGNRPFYVAALHAKYGPVVRVSPDQLAYTSGAAWRDIYGHTPGKAQLPKHSQTFTPRGKKDLPNGILTANDKDHARYRKLLAHAFSAKALEEQEPLIMGFVNLLIRRLGERAEDGPQNMVAWYNFTTFDLIGDLAFGEPFDCLAKGEYHSWVSAIFATIKFSVWMNNFRRLGLAPLVVLFVPRSAREARKRHFANARAKVVARLERGTERPDFMSYILRNQGKEGELTVDEMVANASTMIGAGSETTATLLSGATYYLAANPGEMAKVVAEVRGAFQSDGEISLEGVNKLEYLLAVLNESLRIYPPVPTSVPRVVNTKGGRMIAGQWVPEGVSLSLPSLPPYSEYLEPLLNAHLARLPSESISGRIHTAPTISTTLTPSFRNDG